MQDIMEDRTNIAFVQGKVWEKGLDDALVNYSDFKEVKDKKFHKLRADFLKARKELINYIAKRHLEEEEKLNR